MSIYDTTRAIATKLLTKFDQGGLVLRVATGGGGPAYNPGTTTYAGILFPGTAIGVSAKYLNDALIQSTDLMVTMPASYGTPALKDKVTIGGVDHEIVKIEAKPAAGTVSAYRIICRK